MRGKILVVADEETVFGLRLLGLTGRAVANLAEARAAIREASPDADVALILLGENLAAAAPEAMTATGPLVVEIPSSEKPRGLPGLEERIERALGVRLAS